MVEFQQKIEMYSNTVVSPEVRWIPPPSEVYKVNFDDVTFEDQTFARVCSLIRDERGQLLAAQSMKEEMVNDTKELETLHFML